jgi:hypothetical protein
LVPTLALVILASDSTLSKKLEGWAHPEIQGSVEPTALRSASRNPKFFWGVSSNHHFIYLYFVNVLLLSSYDINIIIVEVWLFQLFFPLLVSDQSIANASSSNIVNLPVLKAEAC